MEPQFVSSIASNSEQATREELAAVTQKLGPEEALVLLRIARRLEAGQRTYGPLSLAADRRDFAREGREEIEDFLVYAACGWLKGEATK